MNKYEALLAADGLDPEAAKYLSEGQKKQIDDFIESKERHEKVKADCEHRKLIKDGVRLLIEKNCPQESFRDEFYSLYPNIVSIITDSILSNAELELKNGAIAIKGQGNEPSPKNELEKLLHAAEIRLNNNKDDLSIDDVIKAAFRDHGISLMQGASKKKTGLTLSQAKRIMRGKKDSSCVGSCELKI